MTAPSPKTPILMLARYSSLAALSLWALPAHAANLVTNGTFDGTDYTPWTSNATTTEANPADVALAITDGKLCATMTAAGKNPWDVGVTLGNIPLGANKYYHVAFDASADMNRTFKAKVGLADKPYTDYFVKTVSASPTVQRFEFTYLNLRENATAILQFQIGKFPGLVCVDNVVVEEVPEPVLPAYVTPSKTGHSLKSYTKQVKMGTAVDSPIFLSSPQHNAIVVGEFSAITPANSMKMNNIQPQQGVFDWTDTDALVAWAAKNNLEFRGHPLVWHTQAPSWLKDATFVKDDTTMFTPQEIRDTTIAVMYAHIDALMGKYLGKFPYWDVVNEALDDAPGNGAFGYRTTFWLDRIGPDFIELAFRRAHQADPNAKLFYNDYNIEQKGNQKGDRAFELVKDLKTRGVPIDGVGLQGHYFYYVNPDTGAIEGIPDMEAIRANVARYNEIGVQVHITESDFRLQKPIDDARVQAQTKFYADFLQICIDAPNCDHFTVWGMSDIDSWVPSTFPEFDSAHLFDANFSAKPGYTGMTEVFAKYSADDASAGGGKDSGCSLVPGMAAGKAAPSAALLGLLGLSMFLRRGSKRS